jgi:hypothetical protein
MSLSNASSQTLSAPASPIAGPAMGGGEGTPPGSPRLDTGPAPRNEAWYNPPRWMREPAVPLTRANALRISTHQEFTAEELDGEGSPPGNPSIPAPRVGTHRPYFMEPLTTGSSAVSSPVDRGDEAAAGEHIAAVMLRDYCPRLVLPALPLSAFEPQEPTVLPPSTPIPDDQD